jgi:hypothetical protein
LAFKGVQIFCREVGSDVPVFDAGTFGASYQTSQTLCPQSAPTTAVDGGVPPSAIDPNFLCSELLPSTTTSHRITGLKNGTTYGVTIAAIDKYGNIGLPTAAVTGQPFPTVDFYSEYKKQGGAAQGGYCAMARTTSRCAGIIGLGLLGLVLAVVGRKWKRKRRPFGPGALIFLISAATLASAPARAQAITHYEDDVDDETSRDSEEPWTGTSRSQAIELRFGLYNPAVDSEFGSGGAAPHAFIFGKSRSPMWQLEYDYQILQVFGTLAVGGAIGYFKQDAKACVLATMTDTFCERSGDNTSLRLIPLAALLVYRLDEAAKRWKIPLVPYAKVGLNYTFWTINDGNGNVPSVGGGRGQGGTAGWQAAIGLSLQLDFLDSAAARGFDADVGVNHSYIFFEMDHIDGSGLYRKDVLRVGDTTWFAGLMFEF